MNPFVPTALVSLVAAVVLTAAVRAVARRWGVVDRPDGRRKLHERPVPLWGGAAVYGAAVLGLLSARFLPGGAGPEFLELSTVWIVSAGFVCFIGGIDDRFDLPSRVKLLLQIVAVLPIVLFGYYVDRVVAFGYPIELGWLGVPLTVLWLVGCINALNLIDGMDGLASIVGLSAAVMMGIIAAGEGHPHVALMAAVLAASLLGFLAYNFPPASVFLGDSGSMVIGLSLGLLGIQGSLKTTATLAVTAPAVVMTLPMFDVLAAVVRRKLTGRRLDAPDRLHIHHRLLDRGWTPWQVLCLVGAVCLTTGAAATAATIFRLDALAWITAVTLVVLMVRLRLFGYEEFALLKGAVVRGMKSSVALSRPRRAQALVLPMSETSATPSDSLRLDSSPPSPVLWDLLLQHVRTWNIRQVEYCVTENNRVRRIRWIDPSASIENDDGWSLSVSIPHAAEGIGELRVVAPKPIVGPGEIATLKSLLQAFATHFVAHAEQIFGPSTVVVEPITTYPEPRRKAA